MVEPPMRRAKSFPTTGEPVEPCGDVGVHSLPGPYSAPPVQNFSSGNGNGRFNYQGQAPLKTYTQPSIPEMINQDNPELVLTEGKAKSILTSPLRNNQVLTTVGGQGRVV